jgi:predicted amidohydrolase
MSSTTSIIAPVLKVGVMQFAPALRQPADNIGHIAAAAAKTSVDLLITPELSVTGYDVRDGAPELARPLRVGDELTGLAFKNAVLVGAIDRDDAGVPFNAAALVGDGRISFVHRKIYLPTYGMFDEGRYSGAGTRVESFTLNGWRLGVLICEDLWHAMLTYLLALQGVHAIVVMAAAPGRGAWTGGEEGAFFASSDSWQRIARAYAQLYGVYVIVCNRVGVEGGVTFAGESFVVAPDASVIATAGVDEQMLEVDLVAANVRTARTPYAHIRDEDAALAMREIARLTQS